MQLIKVISTRIAAASRLVKFLRLGKYDVQEVKVVGPYGVDSAPIKDVVGLYVKTGVKGESVLVGYINKNQLADIGEHRLFSTNSEGQQQTYVWLKNDGILEIGGDDDFMVRYSKMAEAYNEMKTDINNLKTLISTWTPVPTDGGASLQAFLATWSGTNLTKNIEDSKIDTIKTKSS